LILTLKELLKMQKSVILIALSTINKTGTISIKYDYDQ
jgi:hypothetical protein